MPQQRHGFWKRLVMAVMTVIGIIALSAILLPVVIVIFASAIAAPLAQSWLGSFSP